jgi:hypothetical protein
MREFYDAIISAREFDEKQPHHKNFFYEFFPILRVVESLDGLKPQVRYTGLTGCPFDAVLVFPSGHECTVECTTAIDFRDFDIKKEYIREKPEESFNLSAPVKFKGSKHSRKIDSISDDPVDCGFDEIKLMELLASALRKKSERKYFRLYMADWLVITFQNTFMERDVITKICDLVSCIAIEMLSFDRLFVVGLLDDFVYDSRTIAERLNDPR